MIIEAKQNHAMQIHRKETNKQELLAQDAVIHLCPANKSDDVYTLGEDGERKAGRQREKLPYFENIFSRNTLQIHKKLPQKELKKKKKRRAAC